MEAKTKLCVCLMCFLLVSTPARPAADSAVGILTIVKEAIIKVIKAIDLRIQRLQNKTIWLQQAQKKLENTLTKLKLDEISDWSKKQKELYQDYFDELKNVKSTISYYQRIKDVTQKQVRLIDEYERAWNLFRQDENFNDAEIDYMEKIYNGILDESANNIDHISMILESFTTQMTDAKRLEIINEAADKIDQNYDDLKQFNNQNIKLSIQRSKTQNDVESIKKLYGIP